MKFHRQTVWPWRSAAAGKAAASIGREFGVRSSTLSRTLAFGLLWLSCTLPSPAQTAATISTATTPVTTAGAVTTATPAVPYVEITRQVRQFKDHTETYIRIQPPKLAKPPPSAPPPAPTADDLARLKRWAAKTNDNITMTAVVHLGKQTLTELSWMIDEKTYHALSNVDFRLFSQVTTIETDDMVISWYGFVYSDDGALDAAAHADALRQLTAKGAKPDYVFEGKAADLKANTTALEALDYFHAQYKFNQDKLMAAYQKLQAENEARLSAEQKAPKPSPTIYYWPMTSTKP